MLDRESIYVKNNIYEATFLATDNGKSHEFERSKVPLQNVNTVYLKWKEMKTNKQTKRIPIIMSNGV